MKHRVLRKGCRFAALLMICVIAAGVLLSGGSVANADSKLTDATVKKYEEQIADLQKQQKEIQNRLSQLSKEGSSLSEQKRVVDTYMDTTQRKIEIAQTLLAELDGKINAARFSIDETQAEYDRMYELFVRMMVMNHEQGETSYLGLILGSDSLGDFLAQTEHVSRLLAYNKSVMDNLKQTQAELEDERLSLEAKIAIQNETIATLQADMEDLEKQEADILKKMANLEKDQAAAQKEYYANKKLEDELDKELEEYLAELQRKNQAKMESGDWRWPIDLDDYQYNSSGFGWRKLSGVWDYHRGWDIAAYRGTPIHAAKGGQVVIATYHNSYGNYVVIDHGDGVSTVYAHCSKLTVTKGATVKKGDKIGEVGTTGNSTGNHLHFEFRLNGKYIDPFTYIKNPPIKIIASRYQK